MTQNFDLLGDPIPEGRGKPGATGHIPTAKNVNIIRWLLVSGMKKPGIAGQLGISIPTLNKHYFKNLTLRNAQLAAISEARGRTLLQLDKAAQSGSVSAMKEIGKISKQAELECLASDIRKPTHQPKSLGVKAKRSSDAKPDGSWSFLSPATSSDGIH